MQINTSGMSAEDMRDIAEYFALQKQPRTIFRADPAKAAQGKARAEQLECASCHQADYFGKDNSPRLAGQWPDYLRVQFKNFRTGARSHGLAAATDAKRNPTVEDAEVLVSCPVNMWHMSCIGFRYLHQWRYRDADGTSES